MKRAFALLSALLLTVLLAGAAQTDLPHFNVRNYGAVADGQTNDAPAIDRAIAAAAAAGGGTVYFGGGTYASGTIHLKSNVALYLDQGATLEAISDPTAYDPPEPNVWGDEHRYQDFGHSHWNNSLIVGVEVENISILGPGLIHGKGLGRSLNRRDNLPDTWLQNKSIALKNCRNVILRDFSMLHGGHFAILATGVDNLTIDNLKIDTNRDGMDIDSCRNVRISNCSINSPWDDAICLKSSYGLGEARATENVTITNCLVAGGWEEGTMLDGTYILAREGYQVNHTGRIKFGTESNGGFKNITISNCLFTDCQGLALETVDGGFLEDVTITNITMRNVITMPIFLRLGSRMRGPEGVPVGELRRINISNIVAYDCQRPSIISGIPGHAIEDVTIRNIQIFNRGGGTAEQAAADVPERENAYPEPGMFGRDIPASAFFIRHVDGLTMSDIRVENQTDDLRPALALVDVHNARFRDIESPHVPAGAAIAMRDVANIRWTRLDGTEDRTVESAEQARY